MIKLVALVIMTIDHVGAYLYPDMLWWRAVGRTTFPVWFFLIGHAPTKPVSRELLGWAVLLLVLNPFLGAGFFPTNALITLAFCQWAISRVERQALLDREPFTLVLASFLLFLPSFLLMEYGTLGFMYALMGLAVRTGRMENWRGKMIACVALGGFLVVQCQILPYSFDQCVFMVIGTSLVTFYLARFIYRPVVWIPAMLQRPILYWSRHSMQYYVLHRLVLQSAGVLTRVLTPGLRWI